MIPNSTPKAALAKVAAVIKRNKITDTVVVVGVRNYYNESFDPGGSGRGLYDDAMFIVSPTHFSSYNANTDPSVFRPGIATLATGVHRYKRGNHGISRPGGGYPAFRPATKNEELPVTRDGVSVNPKPGVAINIHRGSNNSTSSLGCQTIPPSQWSAFYASLDNELKKHGQKDFPYLLLNETDFASA